MSNLHFESLESAWLERRQSERVDAKLKVLFKELRPEEAINAVHKMEASNVHLLATEVQAQFPEDVVEAISRDVSISGIRVGGDMQLLAGRNLSPGNFLELEITFPFSSHSLRAIAVVAWSRLSQPGEFEAGLSFFALDEGDLQFLQKFVGTNKVAE